MIQRMFQALMILLFAVLSGCSSQHGSSPSSVAPQTAEQWLNRAKVTSGIERNRALLEAATLQIHHRADQDARMTLSKLPETLPRQQRINRDLLRAQLALGDNDSNRAKQLLATIDADQLAPENQHHWFLVQEQLARSQRQYWHAAQYLAFRFDTFTTQPQRQRAAAQMRYYLTQSQREQTFSAPLAAAPDPFSGWVSLYRLLNGPQDSSSNLLSRIQQWQQAYPDHPASSWLPDNLEQLLATANQAAPQRIAVLLPLSGTYQRQGEVIRDGLIYGRLNEYDSKLKLFFFDTATHPLPALLHQIQQQSIDFIVGPLLKPQLQTLMAQPDLNIPVLALNSPDQEMLADNHYFLSLAPEHEATNVAARMRFDGIKHPLLLIAGGRTPSRMAESFNHAWQPYLKDDSDIATPVEKHLSNSKQMRDEIEQVLGLSASKARATALRSLLATDLDYEARSRRDIDGVYLLGDPSEVRLQKSFVDVTLSPFNQPPRFYLSARGFSSGHKDLNGIRIADLPLLLDQENDTHRLREQLRTNQPDWSDNDLRLFALGADAYRLLPHIRQLRMLGNFSLPGLSGQLSVNQQGLVEQQFSWAQVSRGKITPLVQ